MDVIIVLVEQIAELEHELETHRGTGDIAAADSATLRPRTAQQQLVTSSSPSKSSATVGVDESTTRELTRLTGAF